MATLTLRVITPDKIALDASVASVVIPGADGQIGILPRHAPMISALNAGLLRYTVDGRKSVLFVTGGFAEVRGETVRVVTEAGEKPEEIDEARAKEAEKRARARIAAGKTAEGDPVDLLRAEAALRRALLRLSARESR
ncbi:MAG: F0F1 ATP synthase subunit epsilon [Planctomycetes bacterium]|nr:F0F1 ATP synthase subunit epsilon [Planctomycetota bacterium]